MFWKNRPNSIIITDRHFLWHFPSFTLGKSPRLYPPLQVNICSYYHDRCKGARHVPGLGNETELISACGMKLFFFQYCITRHLSTKRCDWPLPSYKAYYTCIAKAFLFQLVYLWRHRNFSYCRVFYLIIQKIFFYSWILSETLITERSAM